MWKVIIQATEAQDIKNLREQQLLFVYFRVFITVDTGKHTWTWCEYYKSFFELLCIKNRLAKYVAKSTIHLIYLILRLTTPVFRHDTTKSAAYWPSIIRRITFPSFLSYLRIFAFLFIIRLVALHRKVPHNLVLVYDSVKYL